MIMKQRILSILLALVICVTGMISWDMGVNAEVESEDIEISEIMTDGALIGYAESQTWGVYLLDGSSIINKISSTKIGAGGTTNAAVQCTVSITCYLERKSSSGSWGRVTSWSASNTSAYVAMISKSVTVASGYYYRIRSTHKASTDTAYSYTSALLVN